MNSLIKLGIVGGLVALVVWGTKAAKEALQKFTYEIAGFGKPSISSYQLRVPVRIRFNNPTPVSINADQLIADVYLLKNNAYVIAARVKDPVTIAAGVSEQTFNVAIDLKSIFGGNLLNTADFVTKTLQSKTVAIKVDVVAVYQGITLPKQVFEQTVPLT